MTFWDQVIADQIGAVESAATALAFGITAVAFRGARRDKVREQAEHISAWFEFCKHAEHIQPGEFESVDLVVRNGSGAPVYSFVMASERYVAEPQTFEVLPPGHVDTQQVPGAFLTPTSSLSARDLRVWFVDAAGRAWTRGGNGGSLRRVRRLDERMTGRLCRLVLPDRALRPWAAVAMRAPEFVNDEERGTD